MRSTGGLSDKDLSFPTDGHIFTLLKYQDASGANSPVLASNMIPVVYNETNTRWEKADVTGEWYNYGNQMWANAVVVTNDTRETYQSANAGEEVKMDDILQMYVWIPRYSYTINFYNNVSAQVKFIPITTKENGSAQYAGTEPSEWFTPPGFTFGEKELPGLWIGKFESGTIDGTKPGNVATPNLLAVKPNKQPWTNLQVSTAYSICKDVTSPENIYGFNSTYDAHMAKNTEWATLVYLTQSVYGKYGNALYTVGYKTPYYNNYNSNNTEFRTGCSSGEVTATNQSSCIASYDNIANRGSGKGAKGAGASTTGNIYGVYDTTGGAGEYLMAGYQAYSGYTSKSHSGFTGSLGDGSRVTGKAFPVAKYYDTYRTNQVTTACNGSACKGHALDDASKWDSNATLTLATSDSPWIVRERLYAMKSATGYFSSATTFRIVLTP